jgi:polyisoprenoid-binding protein YceI
MKGRLFAVAIGAALAFNSSLTAADTYTIDPAHTRVGFSARHLGISNVKGRFKEFTGTLVLEGSELKQATAAIQVQSVDTGVPQRDTHLRTRDFFDATNYPTITFNTKKVQHDGDSIVLIGDFTMRGVTKELTLPLILSKPIKDSSGATRVGLEATAKLNRKDYGIKHTELLETGVPDVADEIALEINAEAIKETPPKDDKPK